MPAYRCEWQKALSKGLSDAVRGHAKLTSDMDMLEAAPWIIALANPFDDAAIVVARQGTHFALDPNLRRLNGVPDRSCWTVNSRIQGRSSPLLTT